MFSGSLPQQGTSNHVGMMHHGMGHGAGHGGPMHHDGHMRSIVPQLTVATGYVALGLLALTLLVGPVNLWLGRRVPVSNYLSRDAGIWAAAFSLVHTIVALLAHTNGNGLIASFLHFFVAPDGRLLTNNFGLGNWTGLAALVIVAGLLAISSDFALGKLKARLWKRLQRLNYALFALVVLHAVFYGALLRRTSPFTLLLGLSGIAVFAAQAVGIWLWRRRYSRAPTTVL
jgi:sulfoxide reductase heme-binding subunit YedZ